MTVPNLSDVLETASCGGSSIITVIQFLHFYELDPTIGCDKHADVPWFTLWLYAGNVEDVEEDAECGADNECWVKKYAAQLEGVWYDSAKLQLAVDRVVSALREAGYDVLTTSLAGD